MHQALLIYDIFVIILSHIGGSDQFSRKSTQLKALARLARCCRLFTDPALDELWKRQISLFPLFRVIPSFQETGGSYSFDRPIGDQDWERFKYYAKRIQTLVYQQHSRIHPSAYSRLRERLGYSSMFPSLRNLQWRQAAHVDDLSPMLFSPSLRSIAISLAQSDAGVFEDVCDPEICENHSVKSFLDMVLAHSPGVERLIFDGPCPSSWAVCIQGLTSLQHLTLGGLIDVSHVIGLSNFPLLAGLSVTVGGEITCGKWTGFSSLQSLVVSGDVSAVACVLESVESRLLRSVTITSMSPYLPSDCSTCMDLLSRPHFQPCLQRVHLRLALTTNNGDTPPLMDVIRPLLEVNLLRDVSFDFNDPVYCDDSDMTAMASAWPHLRRLHIWHRSPGRESYSPTVESLYSFASRCLELRDLSITMNAQSVSSLGNIKIPPHLLQALRFLGDVRIQDVEATASFIRQLFPHLRLFQANAWDTGMSDMWSDVAARVVAPRRSGVNMNTERIPQKRDRR